MALCDQIVGVKNILLKFTNCETGEVIGPIAHELSKEDLPKWRTHAYKSEMLPGGYVKKHHISAACEMDIRRDLRVSLRTIRGVRRSSSRSSTKTVWSTPALPAASRVTRSRTLMR